jgi:hypothetical protein
MESSEPTGSSQPLTVTKVPWLIRIPSSLAFLVGGLLFFLPFVELKCNGELLAKPTGIDLATGKTAVILTSSEKYWDKKKDWTITTTSKEQDPNIFAISALVLGALGFIIALLNFQSTPRLSGVIAILAIAAMIALMLDIKWQVNKRGTNINNVKVTIDSIKVTADFTKWYFLTICSFLLALLLSFIKPRK